MKRARRIPEDFENYCSGKINFIITVVLKAAVVVVVVVVVVGAAAAAIVVIVVVVAEGKGWKKKEGATNCA